MFKTGSCITINLNYYGEARKGETSCFCYDPTGHTLPPKDILSWHPVSGTFVETIGSATAHQVQKKEKCWCLRWRPEQSGTIQNRKYVLDTSALNHWSEDDLSLTVFFHSVLWQMWALKSLRSCRRDIRWQIVQRSEGQWQIYTQAALYSISTLWVQLCVSSTAVYVTVQLWNGRICLGMIPNKPKHNICISLLKVSSFNLQSTYQTSIY